MPPARAQAPDLSTAGTRGWFRVLERVAAVAAPALLWGLLPGLNVWRIALPFLLGPIWMALALPTCVAIARASGALALRGGRGLHRRATPLAGGFAFLLPVLGALAAGGVMGVPGAWHTLGAGLLLTATGLLDDVVGLGPAPRLVSHVLAGALLARVSDGAPFGSLLPAGASEWLAPALTTGWVVLVLNAFNVIDGMDGVCAALALLAALLGLCLGADVLACVGLISLLIGFLLANVKPAWVYLGNLGSQLVGFCVVLVSLRLGPEAPPHAAFALAAYPVGDLLVSIVRRLARGKPVWTGDVAHVHHQLRDRLGSTERGLLATCGFAFALAVLVLAQPPAQAFVLWALAWCAAGVTLFLWSPTTWAQVRASRPAFRALHRERRHALAAVHAAPDVATLWDALARHAPSLGLVGLSVDRWANSDDTVPGTVRVRIALRGGRAAYALREVPQDPALARETHAVVTEVVRSAHARWRALGGGRHPDAGPVPLA
jgi:UDP-GlcNAc:undecaprenyl-phosphate/decaprenyl-phosphate GlcNAc-1-phosphate transferase